MSKKKDYEIGYKKPPKKFQFKKGQSGNPKGRPKKEHTFSYLTFNRFFQTFVDQGAKQIKVKENDGEAFISQLEGVVARLYQKAISGNVSASRLLLSIVEKGSISFEKTLNSTYDMVITEEIKEWDNLGSETSDLAALESYVQRIRVRRVARTVLGEEEIPYEPAEPKTLKDLMMLKDLLDIARKEET